MRDIPTGLSRRPSLSSSGEGETFGLRLSEFYPQLRRLAAVRMAGEYQGHTLQPTALVHEAWIRLSAERSRSWCESAARFFAAASETMRRVLIDHARRRARVRHGGEWVQLPFEAADRAAISSDEELLLIDGAVERLATVDPVRARVVVLKFFGGLSTREVAEEMGLGERTVERYWLHAKAWLYREIRRS